MDFDACFLSLCLIKFCIIIDSPKCEQFTYLLSAVGGFPAVWLSINETSWKRFLHWKLLDNICSSGLKQNHQTKSSACEFEKFFSSTFPLFSHFWTTNENFLEKMFSDLSSSATKSVKCLKRTSFRWFEHLFW